MDTLQLTKIINCWDPIALISSHAPQDEYSLEIREIQKYCQSNDCDMHGLAKKIHDVFTDSFGGNVFSKSAEDCMHIAIKILENK